MAFLCPVRIRRGKKKKPSGADVDKDLVKGTSGLTPGIGMGRITGSASIETLVRVGIEKEHGLSPDSKMVVLHDFAPCVDDELEVKRGQVVNILYRENDWVQLAELAIKKKLPRNGQNGSIEQADANHECDLATADTSDCDSLDMSPFSKDPSGRYIVLYTFIARDENDVSVERGEFVTVLNREDPDWYWIVRSDGQEGFIPSGFVYNLVLNREDPDWYWIVRSDGQEGFIPSGFVYPADNVIQGHLNTTSNQNNNTFSSQNNGHHINTQSGDDLRYHGTELVMLYDYKAQAPDDLSVRRGDWIYADLTNQTVDGWLWAYAPKTRKYGFIPKAYARPPAMTSL
ncbi:Variant SH3 domain [Popillia japonica]|uniref:Variant SH3 domain n=1 Tax=Popillia japonica TaxID=7064 RepID=A0AAW1MG85_POPJA